MAYEPGLHALECEKCGAALAPPDQGHVVTCTHCGHPHMWVPPASASFGHAPVQPTSTTSALPRKDRRATIIVAVLIVAAIMIAVGGTTAMIWLRRSAPNDAFEMIVTPTLPLAIGDQVTYVDGTHSCFGVPILGIEPDGRVTIMACEGASRPVAVSRAMLRVTRFPHENGATNPQTGDIVLVLEGGRYTRAEIIAPEPAERIRIRPLRVAPGALDVPTTERIVDQATAILVGRPNQTAGPLYVPIGEAPLDAGDTLRELVPTGAGAIQHDVVVVEASSGRSDVLVQRMVGDAANGAPSPAARARLYARVLRVFDAAALSDVVAEPTADGMRRVAVVRDEGGEMCVRDLALDAATACHALPKSAILVLRSATR